jgi:threonine dehydrogenase-like Zn-dependent dehydrogenase
MSELATTVKRRPVARMRAAVLSGPGHCEVQEVSLPEPGPNQVRIRLDGCGVCGSNLPLWEGRDWIQYPFAPGAPGHEGWGVVDAVGAEVQGLLPGTPVTALSSAAFAEYDLVDVGSVLPLHPALAKEPFPGEPLGCAMNVFRRSAILPGHTVAVIGIGFLGAVLTQLAVHAGAQVIAITRRRYALDLAGDLGAWKTVPMDDHFRIVQQVKELTNGQLCDRVIEAVGAQWPLDLAGELTRERGRVVIAGYHQDGVRQVNLQLWNWRGLDVINAHERDPAIRLEGMRLAMDAVAHGRLDPAGLYTHSFALEHLSSAFEVVRDRPDGFMKALITLEPPSSL